MSVSIGSIIITSSVNENIIKTLESIPFVRDIVLGVIGAEDEYNITVNLVKSWGVQNHKMITVMLITDENITKIGYAGLANKLLEIIKTPAEGSPVDYILYLNENELVKNGNTIAEIISGIHNTPLTGVKTIVETIADTKEEVRIIKTSAVGEWFFRGFVEPYFFTPFIGKTGKIDVNVIKRLLTITSFDKNDEHYKKILMTIPPEMNNSDIKFLKAKYFSAQKEPFLECLTMNDLEPDRKVYCLLALSDLDARVGPIYLTDALKLKKYIDIYMKLAEHYRKIGLLDIAYMFAEKACSQELTDCIDLNNRYYGRYQLLAGVGTGLVETNPKYFAGTLSAAIKAVMASENIAQDSERLEKLKEMIPVMKSKLKLPEQFQIHLQENLAMMQEPTLAFKHALTDVKALSVPLGGFVPDPGTGSGPLI